MNVVVYDAWEASDDDGPDKAVVPVSALPSRVVTPQAGWRVWEVIEAGGGYGMNSFVLLTSEIEANVRAGQAQTIAAAFNLLGLREDGTVYFQAGEQVSWADFVRAADAGLYEGDPSKIIFYGYGTAGGSFAETIPDIVEWVANGTTTVLGVAAIAKFGSTFTESRRKRTADVWRRNGVVPSKLREYVVLRRQHDPAIFAQYFGMSEAEAKAVLEQLGLREMSSGLWRRPSPSP